MRIRLHIAYKQNSTAQRSTNIGLSVAILDCKLQYWMGVALPNSAGGVEVTHLEAADAVASLLQRIAAADSGGKQRRRQRASHREATTHSRHATHSMQHTAHRVEATEKLSHPLVVVVALHVHLVPESATEC
jgi:hypothetical protein